MMGAKKKKKPQERHFNNGLIEEFRQNAAKPDKDFIKLALKKSKSALASRPVSILDQIPYKKIIRAVDQH